MTLSPARMSVIAERLPSKQDFSDHLNSVFHARSATGDGFDLCLIKFDELVSNSAQENYSLLFRAPADTPPEQGIYRLEHDALSATDIFLVPVKQDGDGLYFEAIFNQLIGTKA